MLSVSVRIITRGLRTGNGILTFGTLLSVRRVGQETESSKFRHTSFISENFSEPIRLL